MNGTKADELPDRIVLTDTKFTILGYKDLIDCKESVYNPDFTPRNYAHCRAELIVPHGSHFRKTSNQEMQSDKIIVGDIRTIDGVHCESGFAKPVDEADRLIGYLTLSQHLEVNYPMSSANCFDSRGLKFHGFWK